MQAMLPTKSSFLFLQGASVYYEFFSCSRKSKGTLLFIHGFFASTVSFHRLIPFLISEYDILCFDLPGFGRSSKGRGNVYSFSGYTTVVASLMDHFTIHHACLIGHSMGGQIALNVAKRKPERVQSLVLLASSGYLKRVKQPYRLASYMPLASVWLNQIIRKPDVKSVLNEAVYDKTCINEAMIQGYRIPLKDQDFAKGLIQLTRQREGDLATADLQNINVPTFILSGMDDPLIPVKTSKRLFDDLPNSEIHLIKRCGHLLAEEKPREVAKKVKLFLRKVHEAKTTTSMIQ